MSALTDFLAGKFLAETDDYEVGAIGEALPDVFRATNNDGTTVVMRDGVVVRWSGGRIGVQFADNTARSSYLFETREAAQAYIDKLKAEEAAE